MRKETDCTDDFTVIKLKRRERRKLRGIKFRKQVLSLNTPEDLLEFFFNNNMGFGELMFFVERTSFVYSNMRKEFVNNIFLQKTSMLFRLILASGTNFDRKFIGCGYVIKVKKNLDRHIHAINVIAEMKAAEFFDEESVYKMLSISMDINRHNGPMMKRLNFIMK